MATRPLLIFPTHGVSDRSKLGSGARHVHYPPAARQAERLLPQIHAVEAAFEAGRAELRAEIAGAEPEKVLVLETVGTITDFMNAVRRIPGMEWMAEVDEDEIAGDEDFFDSERPDRLLGGRLFLVMTNQAALRNLLTLWNAFQENPDGRFARGFGKWRSLFKQLKTIRVWGVEDRLRETGLLEVWQEETQHDFQTYRFEAELWFRDDENRRRNSVEELRTYVERENGRILSEAAFAEIAYHGVIGQIPAAAAQSILERRDVRLLQCDQVMFFRPVGQMAAPLVGDNPSDVAVDAREGVADRDPRVALLDGLPLENHLLLAGRLIVDDPDGWSTDYPVQERQHGTAMASLILHGPLERNETASTRRLYVRPVMRPDARDWRTPRPETMPYDLPAPDLLRRAVKRMLEGDQGQDAAASSVRIINFSIGDTWRPYDRSVSAMARAVDWLSWNYRVLFLVSSGNQSGDIRLALNRGQVRAATAGALASEVFSALAQTAHVRRLLSPAESINAVTVGACHSDGSTMQVGERLNPYADDGFPSPFNAVGSGYRRAIKPEVLLDGGRQLYLLRPGAAADAAVLNPDFGTQIPPGQRTAAPGLAGALNGARYTRGTSNATAVVSHHAERISDVADDLGITDGFAAVAIKCLIAHGAAWTPAIDVLRPILEGLTPNANVREQLARFVGYGKTDVERVVQCTERRVTVVGTGEIAEGDGHTYRLPLPPTLSGIAGHRRLVVTLAWFSPIHPTHRNYRRAAMWFNLQTADAIRVERSGCDYRAVQRGTLQHEVFEGEQASAFADGSNLEVKVNCREDAGHLVERVPYCLAVTLEVAPELPVSVYDEVRVRLQVPVAVRVM